MVGHTHNVKKKRYEPRLWGVRLMCCMVCCSSVSAHVFCGDDLSWCVTFVMCCMSRFDGVSINACVVWPIVVACRTRVLHVVPVVLSSCL